MKIKTNVYIVLLFAILFSSCSPINRFTRLKRTPREHSLNYCGTDIKAPYTGYNKETWVVFSDRDNNDTYQNPGGKVKMKKMEFMDPFFVIKEKGEYVRLVKFDPSIVQNSIYHRKIKDRKKAEYYGWVHRSRLLLSKQSTTDISTRFKNKSIAIITDTLAVVEPETFFQSDSIWTYKDENLTIKHRKMPMHGIVFVLKTSLDNNKVLLSRKTIISPEEAIEDVLGWAPTALVKEYSQRLFIDLHTLPKEITYDTPSFKDRMKAADLRLSFFQKEEIDGIQSRNPSFRFNPVKSYCMDDVFSIRFKTGVPAPVIDRKDNYIFNVNGNKIRYSDFRKLENDLKKLNLLFVFEGKEQVLTNFSELLNVVQNLEPMVDKEDDHFTFQFGAVMAYRNKDSYNLPEIRTAGLTEDFGNIVNFLVSENEKLSNYAPLSTNQTWTGVRKAVEMVESRPEETNILVIIGEEGYSEQADSVLVRRMAEANCRILGYQMHSEISNLGNNFVLQIENMIDHCARQSVNAKKEKIVFTDQVKPQHRYRESSKNVYSLDFPDRSMSQGWILFPEKSVEMPLNLLFTAIDTMVTQVKADNDTIVRSLYRAFNLVGNNRYKYEPLWVDYNMKDTTWLLKKSLPAKFPTDHPAWYLPSQPITLHRSDEEVNYHLLLTNSELNEVVTFLEKISANEPDYKYRGKKRKSRKLCNCPDDDLYFQQLNQDYEIDTQGNPVYLNTRKIRLRLYKLYLEELVTQRMCPVKLKVLKNYSLADAHQEIIGSPTHYDMARGFTIKDVKRKKYMTDLELDQLVQHFKKKKDQLIEHLRVSQNDIFVSNDQVYYWINRDLLP